MSTTTNTLPIVEQTQNDAVVVLPPEVKRVEIILIKPSSYDDNGFPYRFHRGVLPSNSLAAVASLMQAAVEQELPADIPHEIHMLEDCIVGHAKELKMLHRRFPEKGTKLIVGFVAVQTAQFPRACGLIKKWQAVGATCLIGGFHVSGSISTMHDGVVDKQRDIPCLGIMPPEIQQLMDSGVVVVHGEGEDITQTIVRDVLNDSARALYRGGRPDLQNAPLPEYDEDYFKGSFALDIRTFDTGRGCPFTCSFCTIINVQGRKQRFRSPDALIAAVKEISERHGRASFFFTDDNFARNPQWRRILEGLIDLRRQGHEIGFMIEADLACGKIEDFIPMLAAAGCGQVFMGVESLNQKNIEGASKPQNKIGTFEALWKQFHEHSILVHAGYIVGFPHDTPESVAQDIRQLAELGVDIASFFMLTPMPGSEDHARLVARGVPLDDDLSRYDSFRSAMDHPIMSRAEWQQTFWDAWKGFYSISNMIRSLKRYGDRERRLALVRTFAWYRWSYRIEKTHPMIAGFGRSRPWAERRAGAPAMSYMGYWWSEFCRYLRYGLGAVQEFFIWQRVVLEVEFGRKRSGWGRRTFGRLASRRWLDQFWQRYRKAGWRLILPHRWTQHILAGSHLFSEMVLAVRFSLVARKLFTEIQS